MWPDILTQIQKKSLFKDSDKQKCEAVADTLE